MQISWIACPADWRHAISADNYVCLECGNEAVELNQDDMQDIAQIDEPTNT